MQDFADRMSESGAQDIAKAQEGLDPMGKMLVKAGAAVTQMGGDAAVALTTGGSSMLPMLTRSFGGGVQEARAKGYSEDQQIALGLANAATEYFSERLFGGNPVYDTDVGLVNRLVGKLVKNPKVMEFLSSAPVEKITEGLEEIVSDLLDPMAEWAITGTRPEYELDQIIEDGIVGVIAAVMAGGGSKVINKVTNLVSDATADKMLLERTTVDFLRRKGDLKLNKNMTQEQKRAALLQAVNQIVERKKENALPKDAASDIIRKKLISGALDPESERADTHAEQYYESVRKMTTDVKRVSENTGIPEIVIQKIKNYIFLDVHDLGDGEIAKFDPSYEMAESWQRLIDGKNIQPHDLTLLHHEIMENELMDQGYTQDEAHRITSRRYNYTQEAHEYHDKIRKHKSKR